MPTNLAFVRDGSGGDRAYVTRHDGSEASFKIWPSVTGLPHDLAHLVVEDELGLVLGFWGLVAAGGRPTSPLRDNDPCQLLQAEAVVNVLTGHGSQVHVTDADRAAAMAAACDAAGVAPPPHLDEATIARLRVSLATEGEAWAALLPGGALRRMWLWPRRAPET